MKLNGWVKFQKGVLCYENYVSVFMCGNKKEKLCKLLFLEENDYWDSTLLGSDQNGVVLTQVVKTSEDGTELREAF